MRIIEGQYAQIAHLQELYTNLEIQNERYRMMAGELPIGLDRATSVTSLNEINECKEIQTDPIISFPLTGQRNLYRSPDSTLLGGQKRDSTF
jgi:hypothetical protein